MGLGVGAVFQGVLIVLFSSIKTANLSTVSCSKSRSTVQVVSNCPVTEEELRKASQMKNCSAFASQCSDPDKFVYHCVINPFLNETLEVCAYEKIILLGFCTEYSYSANRIQQSFKTNCTKFSRNPCPPAYSSTEAYKYPECYELTKKPSTENPTTSMLSTSVSTDLMKTVPVFKMSPAGSDDEEDNGSDADVIGIIVGIVLFLGVVAVVALLYRKYYPKEQGHHQINGSGSERFENENLPLRQSEEEGASEGNKHFAPSGMSLETEWKVKETIPVEEDETPETFLNPPKQDSEDSDCQALVNALSDGLGRMVTHHSEHSDEHDKKLQNFATKIYEKSPQFSNETNATIKEYIKELESLERYFHRPKIKENVFMLPE